MDLKREGNDLLTGGGAIHRRLPQLLAEAYRCTSQTGPPVVRYCAV